MRSVMQTLRRILTGDLDTTGAPPRSPRRLTPPLVGLEPDDPLTSHLTATQRPVDLDALTFESDALQALRDAGVQLIVPLVAQDELVAVVCLGPRRSGQPYNLDDRRLLNRIAAQAGPALRVAQLAEREREAALQRQRVFNELEIAQLIQREFLPTKPPQVPGWKIATEYRPAREVGGDFYDLLELDDGKLGVVIGDVTNKGVPAALVMASLRSVLRSTVRRLADPGDVLAAANEELCPDIPQSMFATCLYGVLEPENGRFRFANAGHNLPCLQTDDGAIEVKATGMPLGLMPGTSYAENEMLIAPGSAVLLYSDALPEAHGPDGDLFGFPRLIEVVGNGPAGPRLINAVLDALHEHTAADWEQEDDITIVCIAREADRS